MIMVEHKMQADMVMENVVRVFHLDMEAIGSGLCHCEKLEYRRHQSSHPPWHTFSHKATPIPKRSDLPIRATPFGGHFLSNQISLPDTQNIMGIMRQKYIQFNF